eukprot:10446543-Lingulodinium_polyedra.AAC.1
MLRSTIPVGPWPYGLPQRSTPWPEGWAPRLGGRLQPTMRSRGHAAIVEFGPFSSMRLRVPVPILRGGPR